MGWGYGTREELLAGGAERIFETVPELDQWLRLRFPQAEVFDAFSRSE